MKSIGIVICNYNKKDFVVNCVKSILNSSVSDFDIIVVDNASDDDSVLELQNMFGDKIEIISNSENLGGSGGFNTGLKIAYERNYKYIMCVDNDIVMDKYAVEELYNYMESDSSIGMLGSKIFQMEFPNNLQEFGALISFDNFDIKPLYKNYVDDELIPEIQYCDYVPACSLMVRHEALSAVGFMPESNFIYWDDMEWGYRFNSMGFKVAAYSKSKVWHRGGSAVAKNTFTTYYWYRNRIKFFAKYTPDDKLDVFADFILTEIYRASYSCNYNKKYNRLQTISFAYDDAVNGITGKASENRILEADAAENKLKSLLRYCKTVIIKADNNFSTLAKIISMLDTNVLDIDITVYTESYSWEFNSLDVKKANSFEPDKYDIAFIACEHVFSVDSDTLEGIYIDSWGNIISNIDELKYCSNFNLNLDLFLKMNRKLFIDKIKKVYRCSDSKINN